jgi:hypothetical protein
MMDSSKARLAVVVPVLDEEWRNRRIRSLDGVRVVPNRWGTTTTRKHVIKTGATWAHV